MGGGDDDQEDAQKELQKQIAEQKAQIVAERKKSEDKLVKRLRRQTTPMQQSLVDTPDTLG